MTSRSRRFFFRVLEVSGTETRTDSQTGNIDLISNADFVQFLGTATEFELVHIGIAYHCINSFGIDSNSWARIAITIPNSGNTTDSGTGAVVHYTFSPRFSASFPFARATHHYRTFSTSQTPPSGVRRLTAFPVTFSVGGIERSRLGAIWCDAVVRLGSAPSSGDDNQGPS